MKQAAANVAFTPRAHMMALDVAQATQMLERVMREKHPDRTWFLNAKEPSTGNIHVLEAFLHDG